MPKRTENSSFVGLSDDKHPWEQQKGETNKAYAAFGVYRDLGPIRRSIVTAQKEGQGSYRSFKNWHRNLLWGERAEAWDKFLDQTSLDAQIADVVKARKRIVEFGKALQAIGGHEMKVMLAEVNKQEATGNYTSLGLKKGELVRFLKEGTRLELIGLGEPVEPQGEGTDGASSYNELAKLAEDFQKKKKQEELARKEREANGQ